MNFRLLKQIKCIGLIKWCVTLYAICFSAVALAAPEFVEGQDYSVVKAAMGQRNTRPSAKNEVIEFFSYGCPGCFALEADLMPWLEAHKRTIQFKREPVAFSPKWVPLAKAYYIAKAYKKEAAISKALFTAIHSNQQDLTNPQAMSKVFQTQGVTEKDFFKAYTYSSVINTQIKQGEQLREQYKITEIPAFVVGGKYVTDLGRVGNDQKKMLALLEYLLHKAND